MWLRSLLSKQVMRACSNSGHPKIPPSWTTTLIMVPTVDLICLSAAPKHGNNSDFIYCWYAGVIVLYAFLRLFFNNNPAACLISTDFPCNLNNYKLNSEITDALHYRRRIDEKTGYLGARKNEGKVIIEIGELREVLKLLPNLKLIGGWSWWNLML